MKTVLNVLKFTMPILEIIGFVLFFYQNWILGISLLFILLNLKVNESNNVDKIIKESEKLKELVEKMKN